MKYQKVAPPVHLKDQVRYFWSLEKTNSDHSATTFRPLADGCPGIMFHQSETGSMVQYGKKLPEIFIYGQTTKPVEIITASNFKTFGAVFQPNALKFIFGFDADEITNSCADFDRLPNTPTSPFFELLADAQSFSDQSALLSASLFSITNRSKTSDDRSISYAVSSIIESKGLIGLKDLTNYLQLSERTFERRFKQWVGISPKLFARICKFQASLDLLRSNNYAKLSDIAFENEYADQSHFIRSFREFSGFSPYQYQKYSNEAIENFLTFSS